MTNEQLQSAASWSTCAAAKTALDDAKTAFGPASKEVADAGRLYGKLVLKCAKEAGGGW